MKKEAQLNLDDPKAFFKFVLDNKNIAQREDYLLVLAGYLKFFHEFSMINHIASYFSPENYLHPEKQKSFESILIEKCQRIQKVYSGFEPVLTHQKDLAEKVLVPFQYKTQSNLRLFEACLQETACRIDIPMVIAI